MSLQKILMVKPRGFCAGVVRAVDIVEEALKITQPVYVRKEIVHNKFVVNALRDKGAIFVDDLEEVPDGKPGDPIVCIFSAHGVSPAVRECAKAKNLVILDATCPLVTKVHLEAIRYAKSGYDIILIGHPGHEEVEGTMGEAPYAMHLVVTIEDVEKLELPQTEKLVYLTQTTLSVDDTRVVAEALRQRFPSLTQPPKDDICYATTNRQSAVKDLAEHCGLILVIGAENSSNSQRLREVAEACGTRAFLINDESSIRHEWLENVDIVGISAGASAPEVLVERVVAALQQHAAQDGSTASVETLESIPESVFFPLPRELKSLPLTLSQN